MQLAEQKITSTIQFEKYNKTEANTELKSGKKYIVLRKHFCGSTYEDVAEYADKTFPNGEEYKGFLKFNGSEHERDSMEIYDGPLIGQFELLNDVIYFAPLKFNAKQYLDFELKILDENNQVMEQETILARKIMSHFLELHDVTATELAAESQKKDFGEDHDVKLAELWDRAFDCVFAACFGDVTKQEGYSMSFPDIE